MTDDELWQTEITDEELHEMWDDVLTPVEVIFGEEF